MKTYLKSCSLMTIFDQLWHSPTCCLHASSERLMSVKAEGNAPLKSIISPPSTRRMEDLHRDFFLVVVVIPELWVVNGDIPLEVFARHENLGILLVRLMMYERKTLQLLTY
jgi:hypothetical protein